MWRQLSLGLLTGGDSLTLQQFSTEAWAAIGYRSGIIGLPRCYIPRESSSWDTEPRCEATVLRGINLAKIMRLTRRQERKIIRPEAERAGCFRASFRSCDRLAAGPQRNERSRQPG